MSQAAEIEMRDSWTIQPPRSPKRGDNITVSEWCLEYDVIPALVPFEYRQYDAIDIIQRVRDIFDDAPKTKATFRRSEFPEKLKHIDGSETYSATLLRLAGSWEYCETSRFRSDMPKKRWANPKYVHRGAGPDISDVDERIEEFRRAASIGTVSQSDLADRFGCSVSAVHNFCDYHDIPWQEWREWGKRRLARTLKLVHRWTPKQIVISTLASCIGVDTNTLKGWFTDRYAADFQPPDDPSDETWFQASNKKTTTATLPRDVHLGPTQSKVYLALAELGEGEHYAAEVVDSVDVSHDAVYNALMRLRNRGIVQSRQAKCDWWVYWVDPDGQTGGLKRTMAVDGDTVDLAELGPRQRETLVLLDELGGEHRVSEIAERTGEVENNIRRTLHQLVDKALVEKRQIDARGWMAYRVAGVEPTIDAKEYGPNQEKVLATLEDASAPLTFSEIVDGIPVLDKSAVEGALDGLREKDLLETEPYNKLGWLKYSYSTDAGGYDE